MTQSWFLIYKKWTRNYQSWMWGDKTRTQIVPRKVRNPSPRYFSVRWMLWWWRYTQLPNRASSVFIHGLLHRQAFLTPSLTFHYLFFFIQRYHSSSNPLLFLCINFLTLPCVFAEANSSNPNSVNLREDWRKRSRPIPPGGTYPAKDHCRYINIPFLTHYIFIIFWGFSFFRKFTFLTRSYFVEAVDAGCVIHIILRMSRVPVLSWEMECPKLK